MAEEARKEQSAAAEAAVPLRRHAFGRALDTTVSGAATRAEPRKAAAPRPAHSPVTPAPAMHHQGTATLFNQATKQD